MSFKLQLMSCDSDVFHCIIQRLSIFPTSHFISSQDYITIEILLFITNLYYEVFLLSNVIFFLKVNTILA